MGVWLENGKWNPLEVSFLLVQKRFFSNIEGVLPACFIRDSLQGLLNPGNVLVDECKSLEFSTEMSEEAVKSQHITKNIKNTCDDPTNTDLREA